MRRFLLDFCQTSGQTREESCLISVKSLARFLSNKRRFLLDFCQTNEFSCLISVKQVKILAVFEDSCLISVKHEKIFA